MPSVNPNILSWARETAGYSLDVAAEKLGFKDTKTSSSVDKLKNYEEGNKAVSRPLLLKMSKVYRRPLLTFYLSKIPDKGDRGEDFRTLPTEYDPSENAIVDTLIRNIKARQETLKSVLIAEEEAEPVLFIGSANLETKIQDLAQDITSAIDFNLDEFRSCSKPDKAFSYLRNKVERTGIYVLLIGNLGSHHTNINPEVFRGFVLADDIAPFIVINDQDSRSAWSFTLLHELVHIWLGQTGISAGYSDQSIEKYCNNVASEILLPEKELHELLHVFPKYENKIDIISDFASARNISSSLVAYRLYITGVVTKDEWIETSSFYREEWRKAKARLKEENKNKEGAPDYFTVKKYKLGNALVSDVARLANSGALTSTKAGLVLGMRALKIHRLFLYTNGNRVA